MHDRIAQPLHGVSQQLQALQRMANTDPEGKQLTDRASVLLQEAITESRNIMYDLYPAGLAEFGSVLLMEDELDCFEEDTGCLVRFDADCPARPPRDVEVTLYRIFREALTNIRRHAQDAKNVTVSFSCNDQVVVLRVQDDGPGFDVEAATAADRIGGLKSMRRRAESLGGSLERTSAPSQGVELTVRVPIYGRDL